MSVNKNNDLPNQMFLGGEQADTKDSIVDLFAEQYKSLYSTPIDRPVCFDPTDVIESSTVYISKEEIEFKIKNLDPNKEAGFDRVPPLFSEVMLLLIH